MSYVLNWTSESKKTFNQNLEYLSKEWNTKAINDFLDRVEETLGHIKKNPKIYTLHRTKDNVYKCVINKRLILYYKIVSNTQIDLLTFWSTYLNPDTLKI